ncbi:hypothetical protein RhiirC2_801353 [Rhizophagus irregularis]|uniref:CCHC-type domain-containing protein n=1 Tax=Rhizophagus irregularis TaxID=588596 RepID=A0A2N1M2G1_9GLOM|nr:hypothetical protein RhiirC2_801353 [Rhizophagus irregularis]
MFSTCCYIILSVTATINLLDNIGTATFAAINNINNGAIAGVAANQFQGRAGILHGQAGAVNTITGADFIPSYTLLIILNANNGGTIVAPGIRIRQGSDTQQFLNGHSSENQMEARHIGLENSVASILNKLEEIERYKTNTLIVTYQGPTLVDIENLINSKIPKLLALAYKLGLSRDVDISKVTLSDLEIFIDTELNKNLPPDYIYRSNQVFGMSSGIRKPKKSKKCSSCGKSSHTKSSCPKSKKGKRKTNYVLRLLRLL